MKKKFIFLGLLFCIQAPILSMENFSKRENNFKDLQIFTFNNQWRAYLIEAVENNDVEKIKELIATGTDLNIQNSGGETALHIAVCKENNIKIEESN